MTTFIGLWLSPLILGGDFPDLQWTATQLLNSFVDPEIQPIIFFRGEDLSTSSLGVHANGIGSLETFEPRSGLLTDLIFRSSPGELYRNTELIRRLSQKVPIHNCCETLIECSSKQQQFNRLRSKIHVPEFYVLKSEESIQEFISQLSRAGRPFVIKLDRFGGQGRVGGFDLEYFRTDEPPDSLVPRLRRYLRLAQAVTEGDVIAQSFIAPQTFHDARARELKCCIVHNRIVASRHTYSNASGWIAAYHHARWVENVPLSELPADVTEQIDKITAEYPVSLGTIDFMASPDGNIFLEVNPNPSDLMMFFNLSGVNPVSIFANELTNRFHQQL